MSGTRASKKRPNYAGYPMKRRHHVQEGHPAVHDGHPAVYDGHPAVHDGHLPTGAGGTPTHGCKEATYLGGIPTHHGIHYLPGYIHLPTHPGYTHPPSVLCWSMVHRCTSAVDSALGSNPGIIREMRHRERPRLPRV